jgi:dTDP-4-dehydrorhamnose 3,5-epimerase
MFVAQDSSSTPFCQWNLVRSKAGVMRGMHVHLDRADYLVVMSGRMRLGLRDLRGCSPTFGVSRLVELKAEHPQCVFIPVGVLHGFHFPEGGIHAYALSSYWQPDTDIGCRWDDPDLGIGWGAIEPEVADRDLQLGTLARLIDRETGFRVMGGSP